jgi:hypothetical protein
MRTIVSRSASRVPGPADRALLLSSSPMGT